jgi:hypothetical protein
MAVIECPRGHPYENTIHSACPTCARERMSNQAAPPQSRQQGAVGGSPGASQRSAPAAGIRQMPKTTSAYAMEVTGPEGQKRQVDPVVGWLVAIEGDAQGRDFPIRMGQNSIGRDRNNRICIEEDGAIARDTHAYVDFDHVNTRFYFSRGKGSALTFLRREVDGIVSQIPILQTEELNPWEVIQLTAKTVVVFVPLCYDSANERYLHFTGYFKWEKPKDQ